MSGSEVMSLLVGFLVASAVSFVVLCLLSSLLRFQGMADQSSAPATEPAEGMESLAMALGGWLSSVPKAPRPFSLLQWAPRAGQAMADGEIVAAAKELRRWLRPSDRVHVLENGRLGVLVAARRGALDAVLRRVRATPSFAVSRWAVGIATHPEDGVRVDPLLAAGAADLERALADENASGPALAPAEPAPVPPSDLLDEATGALKPELFMSSFQKLVATARREDRPLSLLCVRIEHLPRYRDHYGAEGERALFAALGETLRTRVREEDLPARIDAEQCGVILHAGGEAAMRVAQRLSEEIRGRAVTVGSSELKMAAQIGVASLPEDARTARELLTCAERAAHEAVSHGRGACVRFDPERMSAEPAAEPSGPDVF